MKKLFLILSICVGFASYMYAQPGHLSDEKRKEFEAQKIAFFTQELELSPEEAALFWPLYNEMQRKKNELEVQRRNAFHAIREKKNVTDAEYSAYIEAMLQMEQRMIDLKKEYYGKMVKSISATKVWRLENAERKFHRQLFNKLCREIPPRK